MIPLYNILINILNQLGFDSDKKFDSIYSIVLSLYQNHTGDIDTKFDSTYSIVNAIAKYITENESNNTIYDTTLKIYQHYTSDVDTKFDSTYSIVYAINEGIENGTININGGGGGGGNEEPLDIPTSFMFYNDKTYYQELPFPLDYDISQERNVFLPYWNSDAPQTDYIQVISDDVLYSTDDINAETFPPAVSSVFNDIYVNENSIKGVVMTTQGNDVEFKSEYSSLIMDWGEGENIGALSNVEGEQDGTGYIYRHTYTDGYSNHAIIVEHLDSYASDYLHFIDLANTENKDWLTGLYINYSNYNGYVSGLDVSYAPFLEEVIYTTNCNDFNNFYNCSSLRFVGFNNNLSRLDKSISACDSYTMVTIPKVVYVDINAFNGNCSTEDDKIVIPNSVQEVHYQAFQNRTVNSIYFGDNVKIDSENNKFLGLEAFKPSKIVVSPNNPYYSSYNNRILCDKERTKTIQGSYVNEQNYTDKIEITLPSTITTIGFNSLIESRCHKIVMPSNLEKIEQGGLYRLKCDIIDFTKCKNLVEFTSSLSMGGFNSKVNCKVVVNDADFDYYYNLSNNNFFKENLVKKSEL